MDYEAADGLCAFCRTSGFAFRLVPMIDANRGAPLRSFDNPTSPMPEVQLLSNGRYHVMVTSAGGGYSRWKNLALTRWCEDATCDNWGAFSYIRDAASGDTWSTAYQPTLRRADIY